MIIFNDVFLLKKLADLDCRDKEENDPSLKNFEKKNDNIFKIR